MNTTIITGNLTADPKLGTLPKSAKAVCELRLAVEGMGRGNETGFIDVASYGAGADAAGRLLHKGDKIAVEGRIEWRSWEQDNSTRQAYRIVGRIEFLGAHKGTEKTENRGAAPAGPPPGRRDLGVS